MKCTNINMSSPYGQMIYPIEYTGNYDIVDEKLDFEKYAETGRIDFYDVHTNAIRNGNEWVEASINDLMKYGIIIGETMLPGIFYSFLNGIDPVAGNIVSNTFYRTLENRPIYLGITPLPGIFGLGVIPTSYHRAQVRVYIPPFSVNTYEPDAQYALNFSTWINGHEVNLGSYIYKPTDTLVSDHAVMTAQGPSYEYIVVNIVDPWYIIYSDEWKAFRQQVCGETEVVVNEDNDEEEEERMRFGLGVLRSTTAMASTATNTSSNGSYEQNTTGSVLGLSIHPVRETADGLWQEIDNYHGAQNAINISDTVEDYLSFQISDNRGSEDSLAFSTNVKYNQVYAKTVEGFKSYMKETYSLDNFNMFVEMIIQDTDNIYRYSLDRITNPWQTYNARSTVSSVGGSMFMFDNWVGYVPGMFLTMILHITPTSSVDDDVVYMKSNRILLTEDLFKYLVYSTEQEIVNTDDINMTVLKLNTVNKVEQKVIQVARPDDYKANIVKPVFFRVHDVAHLVIHPNVTEHICLNLDAYKSQVDTFILKVEDTTFNEVARVAAGIIFRVTGKNLPQTLSEGVYYILNQDSELVTSGSYVYEN